MSQVKSGHSTLTAAACIVSTRRTFFGGAAAVVIGSGITAGVAASVADFVPASPDTDLIRLCAKELANDAQSSALIDVIDDASPRDPRWSPTVAKAQRVFAECRKGINSAAEVKAVTLDRMAGIQATTSDGLAARALALAQHSGIKAGYSGYAFEFLPGERGGITGRLLHMLMADGARMISGHLPVLDAALLALRPEFDRLHALMIAYNKDLIPDGGTECADYDALCDRIATAQPAVTSEGRAFQAAAAMHHLYYRLNDYEQGRSPTWAMLQGIAGDAYQSVEART